MYSGHDGASPTSGPLARRRLVDSVGRHPHGIVAELATGHVEWRKDVTVEDPRKMRLAVRSWPRT